MYIFPSPSRFRFRKPNLRIIFAIFIIVSPSRVGYCRARQRRLQPLSHAEDAVRVRHSLLVTGAGSFREAHQTPIPSTIFGGAVGEAAPLPPGGHLEAIDCDRFIARPTVSLGPRRGMRSPFLSGSIARSRGSYCFVTLPAAQRVPTRSRRT